MGLSGLAGITGIIMGVIRTAGITGLRMGIIRLGIIRWARAAGTALRSTTVTIPTHPVRVVFDIWSFLLGDGCRFLLNSWQEVGPSCCLL
jgi:hypothetical protein